MRSLERNMSVCVYLSVSTRVITVFPESSLLLGLLLSVWTIFVVSECKKRWKNLRDEYTRLRKEDYSCQVEGVAKSSMTTSVDARLRRWRALTRVYVHRRASTDVDARDARRATDVDGRRRAWCEWALMKYIERAEVFTLDALSCGAARRRMAWLIDWLIFNKTRIKRTCS